MNESIQRHCFTIGEGARALDMREVYRYGHHLVRELLRDCDAFETYGEVMWYDVDLYARPWLRVRAEYDQIFESASITELGGRLAAALQPMVDERDARQVGIAEFAQFVCAYWPHPDGLAAWMRR